MNFLRQSFSSVSEPPPLPPHNNNSNNTLHHQHYSADSDRDVPLRPAPSTAPSSSSFDSDSEDARFPPPSPLLTVDSLRTRNRVPIEDHVDVPADGGGIVIPSRELPNDWHAHGDMASVRELDRGFVFPGEQLSIVVYVSSHDPSMPEIITPFRVAAMMDKGNLRQTEKEKNSSHDASEAHDKEEKQLGSGMFLKLEEHKSKSAALLQLFQNSHFLTRILGTEEQKKTTSDQHADELVDDGMGLTKSIEIKNSVELVEPVPFVLEGGNFDSRYAGGVARNAKCFSFDNGDIAVVLQITVATDLKNDVVLEVLQFEKPGKLERMSDHKNIMEPLQSYHSNSSEQLLQWLLPLDNPPSPPLPSMPISSSFVNSSPQRPSLTTSSGSSLFSFANLRTYSSGSSSQSVQASTMGTPSQLSSMNGLDGWDRSASQRPSKGQVVAKEGLLSFRGAQLEPQRFSVHFGLEGLYVPGWRWRRKLEIIEPVAIESYFADCNTKDLICVSVENVIPKNYLQILVIIDSIRIVCQTPEPSSTPSSLPLACVEVGGNHKLPGLPLRPGEQHSFILKPSNASSPILVNGKAKGASISPLYGHDLQTMKASYLTSVEMGKKKTKELKMGPSQDSGSYILVVSCRCSHTESRLHFKHPIKWQPRTSRDLLLSVSLETVSKPEITNGSLPSFVPKVITIQATNLTSDCLHLTLLAPSSRYSESSLPAPALASSGLPRISSFMSFHERKEWPTAKAHENDGEQDRKHLEASPSGRAGSLQRSLSLPPVRPIESIMGITPRVVKERAISAADIAAENSSARTHLWLQSIIPLGSVPSQSTTAIRCELLPLTDGIITLDTLHISTKERDVYYPEQPLQIYATSSIGIGIP